jgi:23S rRNA (adenine2503-C2)-methyltransferase
MKHTRGLLDVPERDLRDWLESRGQPALRARQIRRWLLADGAEQFHEMTNLPKQLRGDLAADFSPLATRVSHHAAAPDGTHKLLLQLADGQSVECVLIQEGGRRTACISTQVGCGMGCVFCASGLNGLARNLTSGEIVEQLVRLRNLVVPEPGRPRRLSHIVVMGMGEPLANLDNLLPALELAGAKDGLGIGARHVTISTVGLPPKIRRLADCGKPYHLAVSLHAPNDELRSRIVPTNMGLQTILEAADYFFARTGRQVTFEYVLLRNVNDGPAEARELAELLRGRQAHVNLIPFNDVTGLAFRRPAAECLTAFVSELRRARVSVKVRKRKGSAINAACGQLRRQVAAEPLDGVRV